MEDLARDAVRAATSWPDRKIGADDAGRMAERVEDRGRFISSTSSDAAPSRAPARSGARDRPRRSPTCQELARAR